MSHVWLKAPSCIGSDARVCSSNFVYIYQLAFELLIDWSDGRVVMALVSGSPGMSLLVRNRVGSNPTLIISFACVSYVLLCTSLFFCSVGSVDCRGARFAGTEWSMKGLGRVSRPQSGYS